MTTECEGPQCRGGILDRLAESNPRTVGEKVEPDVVPPALVK
jgi:hypothetical protein